MEWQVDKIVWTFQFPNFQIEFQNLYFTCFTGIFKLWSFHPLALLHPYIPLPLPSILTPNITLKMPYEQVPYVGTARVFLGKHCLSNCQEDPAMTVPTYLRRFSWARFFTEMFLSFWFMSSNRAWEKRWTRGLYLMGEGGDKWMNVWRGKKQV